MNLNANGLGSGGGFLPGASSTGTPTAPKEQDQQPGQVANLASHQTALGAGLGSGGPPQAMSQQAAQQCAAEPHRAAPTNQAQGMAQSNDPNIAAQGRAMLAGQQGAAVYGQTSQQGLAAGGAPTQQQGGFGGMLSSFRQRFAQAPWGGQQSQQQSAASYGQPQQGLAAGGGYGGQSPFQHQFAQAGWGGQQYQPAAPAQQQGQFGFGQMAQAGQQLGSGQPQNPNQINQQRAALGSAMNW